MSQTPPPSRRSAVVLAVPLLILLLPLGYSPVVAIDLRADTGLVAPLDLTLTGLPDVTVHRVRYSFVTHGWVMGQRDLMPVDGVLSLPLEALGSHALVMADVDEVPIDVPPVGETLTGVEMVPLPPTASSRLRKPRPRLASGLVCSS